MGILWLCAEITQLSNVLDQSVFWSLPNRNLTLTPVTKKKKNLDVLVPKINLEQLVLFSIFSRKYRELTEVLLCLVPE